jgi:hypothetical protein
MSTLRTAFGRSSFIAGLQVKRAQNECSGYKDCVLVYEYPLYLLDASGLLFITIYSGGGQPKRILRPAFWCTNRLKQTELIIIVFITVL